MFLKNLFLSALLTAASASSALAALNVGAPAPTFKLTAAKAGATFNFSLQDALKRGPVIVYFYPAAFTSGCSLQAKRFADNLDKFTAAGASIIGVSLDSVDELKAFSADPNTCAGKIPVASDADGKTARAFDLNISPARAGSSGGFVERTTFVVGTDGRIVATIGGVSPQANVDQALAVVQKLAAEKKR